jgi:hypothetical protein
MLELASRYSQTGGGLVICIVAASLASVFFLCLVLYSLQMHGVIRTTCIAVGTLIIIAFGFFALIAPQASASPSVLLAVEAVDPDHRRPLASPHYHEDSMIFLTRGRFQRINEADIEEWFDQHRDGLLIVDRYSWRSVGEDEYVRVGAASGINIGRGAPVELLLVEKRRP